MEEETVQTVAVDTRIQLPVPTIDLRQSFPVYMSLSQLSYQKKRNSYKRKFVHSASNIKSCNWCRLNRLTINYFENSYALALHRMTWMKGQVLLALFKKTQPFYGPFSGTTQVSRWQKRTYGLYGARGDLQRQTH